MNPSQDYPLGFHGPPGAILNNPTVYRLYSARGILLYVGSTNNPGARLPHHRRTKWWEQVVTVRLEHFPTMEDARRAEGEAIGAEAPRHNRALPQSGLEAWQARAVREQIQRSTEYYNAHLKCLTATGRTFKHGPGCPLYEAGAAE